MTSGITSPQRVLLIRTDRMGDMLMCLPAIHAIRRTFPRAEITLLLQKGLEGLLENHPDLDRLMAWDPSEAAGLASSLRWGARLRKERFDAAVVLNPTRLFHAAVFLAGIPNRLGYARKWGFLLTKSIPDTKAGRKLHEVRYNLELAGLLGIPPEQPVYRIPVSAESREAAGSLLESAGVPAGTRPFAIHPWTSNPAKSWPLDSFLDLSRRIGKSPVIAIGGPESAGRLSAARGRGMTDLTGKIPLKLLPAVLSCCRLLITNDSGPAHVAAAVGTPTLVVAPREHGPMLERWRPWGESHRILLSPTIEEAAAAAGAEAAP